MIRRNVFVFGNTKSGKTNAAKKLALALGYGHAGASAWARRGFAAQGPSPEAPAEFVRGITAYSIARLRENPDACLDDLKASHDLAAKGLVIEGMRNPRDFISLFDPRTDAAIELKNALAPSPATPFERGVDVIRAYLSWLKDAGLTGERLFVCEVADYDEIDAGIARCVEFLRGLP
jgi:hypothetical protein